MLIAFNKPFGVLCQFTDAAQGRASAARAGRAEAARSTPPRPTLAAFGLPPRVYAAGRLDHDSEGLLLLTDDGALAHRLTDPGHKQPKTYWVQVEGVPAAAQLAQLEAGVELADGLTLPATAVRIDPPALWPRDPPVRFRKTVPDAWLEMTIHEGRNRQVRRMTAAVGLPTLRLVRVGIGPHRLAGLEPGQWNALS
ncbi:MAG: pseudouridine synthase [Lysobacter sp.]|nr:pseudouridine synthase [Lysobacter sp.]